jgi:cellulose synthase/poly-beta-1,6-N-acetylglucosamine synthase-like glycosyltransferase
MARRCSKVLETVLIGLCSILGITYGLIAIFAYVYGRRNPPPVKKDFSYMPMVSIIIPTYNEEKIIQQKLENMLSSAYPLEKMEVIIADCSTDKTPDIVRNLQVLYSNIKLIHEQFRNGVARTLNKAFNTASGEIVIRTDCDSLFAKDSISQLVANFADPKVGAVTGKQIVLNEDKVEENYRSMQSRIQMAETILDSTIIFHGPLCAFRRSLITEINPSSLADDSELALQVRKQGYKAIYDPQAIFYEGSPETFIGRRRQKDRRAQGLVSLLIQNRGCLFNPRYGMFGYWIFPMNFLLMIIAPIIFWITLTTIFTWIAISHSLGLAAGIIGVTMSAWLLRGKRHFGVAWAFLDTQISFLVADIKLLTHRNNVMWQKNEELRKIYVEKAKVQETPNHG